MCEGQLNTSPACAPPPGLPVLRVLELASVDQALGALLGPAEHARAESFLDSSARRDFVAGRVAQRLMAAELLGTSPEKLSPHYWCPDCGENPVPSHGRPGYLNDGVPSALSISLSRSGGWALVAMAAPAGLRIGVDLQRIASVGFSGFDGVALGPAERVRLAGIAPGEREAWRAATWARKEALAKHSGMGLRTGPADIDAFPEPGSGVEVWDVCAAEVRLPGGFVAAVAVSAGGVAGAFPGTARV